MLAARCWPRPAQRRRLIWADIDLADRDLLRREISCFADRRPEIYGGGRLNALTQNFLVSKFRELLH